MSAEVAAAVIVVVDGGRLVEDDGMLRAETPFPDLHFGEDPSL